MMYFGGVLKTDVSSNQGCVKEQGLLYWQHYAVYKQNLITLTSKARKSIALFTTCLMLVTGYKPSYSFTRGSPVQ